MNSIFHSFLYENNGLIIEKINRTYGFAKIDMIFDIFDMIQQFKDGKIESERELKPDKIKKRIKMAQLIREELPERLNGCGTAEAVRTPGGDPGIEKTVA